MGKILFEINDDSHSVVTHSKYCREEEHIREDIHKSTNSTKKDCGQDFENHISLWNKTFAYEENQYNYERKLPEKVDTVVIGGGMAGMLIGYQLRQAKVDAIVLESGMVGYGVTANTTAKITSLHGAIYGKISKAYGKENAKKYYEIQQASIDEYEKIIKEHNIDCGFERKSHTMYSTSERKKLEKEFKIVKALGIKAHFEEDLPLPFTTCGGITFENQAQFHPLKFLFGIRNHIPAFSRCKVTCIEEDGTVTINDKVKLRANHVVIATHYPMINSKGFYFTRLDQERSYAVALKQDESFSIRNMYIDMEIKGHSFRTYNDYLIVGGGNHRTGAKDPKDYYQMLHKEVSNWFPKAQIVCEWSNQDCMSIDGIPYIGQYSTGLKNFYVATGFNQWGMSSSMAAAKILTDLITKGSSEYEEIMSPRRHQLSGAPKFIENTAISSAGLLKEFLNVNNEELENIKNGEAGIVRLEQRLVGVYKDELGELHVVDAKCPHLGCRLEWNPREKTWDCPCHGSRFDIDGKLIDNPAEKNLEYLESNFTDK